MATPLISVKAAQRYVGNRNLIVDAFASWCPHCVDLEPKFNALQQAVKEIPQEYRPTPVRLDADKHMNELREQRIGAGAYPAPIDEAITHFPTVLFLAKDGRAAVYKGTMETTEIARSASEFFAPNSGPPQAQDTAASAEPEAALMASAETASNASAETASNASAELVSNASAGIDARESDAQPLFHAGGDDDSLLSWPKAG